MRALEVLRELSARGIRLTPRDDRIAVDAPKGADRDEIVAMIRPVKAELLPMVCILEALDYGPMKSHELTAATSLDLGTLYQALGSLYDAGLVKTDPECWYYLPAQYTRPAPADWCPSCRDYEARGQRVLACSVCDARVN